MKRRAPVFAVLAALVLTAGWWYLLYDPKLEEEDQIVAETAELETQEAQMRAEIAELERVRDNEMAVRAELARMEEHIPDGVAQPTALAELQDAADRAGVEIETLSFGEPVAVEEGPSTGDEETTLAEVTVAMTVEGGYFQLVDLLRRVEVDAPRAVLVDSVAVAEETEEGFPGLSTSWTGKVFAVVDVAAAVEPDVGDPAAPDGEEDPDAQPEGEQDPEAQPDGDAPDDAGAEEVAS